MSVASFDPRTARPAEITITAAALAHLRAQLEQSGHTALRIGVKESGCNGYMYTMDYLDEHAAEDVTAVDRDGVRVYVRSQDLPLVGGTEVDYVREGLNAQLKFKNPNAESHCGCGESFALREPD